MSVYFARVRGYIKVGYSANPIQRSSSITWSKGLHPADVQRGDSVDLIGWFPGDRRIERLAHAALDAHLVTGEWFNDCADVRDYLRSQDEAVLVNEISAIALLSVLGGMSVTEATAMPLGQQIDRIFGRTTYAHAAGLSPDSIGRAS